MATPFIYSNTYDNCTPITYRCEVPVDSNLSCGHRAQVQCWQLRSAIALGRVECTTLVEKCWPVCGHRVQTQCHVDVHAVDCPQPCAGVRRDCGHLCRGTCGKCRNGKKLINKLGGGVLVGLKIYTFFPNFIVRNFFW
jgi:hypothetical protein